MGKRTFIFKEADADGIERALGKAAKTIEEEYSISRSNVEGMIAEWSHESASRQAQVRTEIRISKWVRNLVAALHEAEKAVDELTELAHDAEVRNVAVLD